MQLIINCPTDDVGIVEFNNAFAKVQKELVLKSIRDLNIDVSSREKVLCFLAKSLREQTKRDWITSSFSISHIFSTDMVVAKFPTSYWWYINT